jgi:methyl-accepting chemotaxis protein
MGKKKDKAEKSKKKKNRAESVAEAEAEAVQPAEAEAEADNLQYEEYVTAADVMALINSLEQGLDRFDKSNQLLRQQISQIKPAPRQHNGVFIFLTLILVLAIAMTGYYGFRINAYTEKNAAISATDIDTISARIDVVDASIRTISSDLNNFNSSLELLSANMSTINKNVNNMAGSVSKLNSGSANNPYDGRYTGRPIAPRQQWR